MYLVFFKYFGNVCFLVLLYQQADLVLVLSQKKPFSSLDINLTFINDKAAKNI